MRIAHLDTGRTWRGGQSQCLLLMRELRARGHAQILLAPNGPLLERARAEGFSAHAWRPHGELDVFAMLAAVAALRTFGAEVAHAHSAHAHAVGVPAARLAGVPAVLVSRRVDFRVRTNPFSALKYRLPVDRYLCISEGVRDAMLASGVPAERLWLAPSGADFAEVRADGERSAPSLREWCGLPAEAEIVGTVASLAPHKNHMLLLEAVPAVLRERPHAHFVWLGEGETRAALERRRQELGLEARVHMPGFHPEARALMRQFDLFVLSSHLEGLRIEPARCADPARTDRRDRGGWGARGRPGWRDGPTRARARTHRARIGDRRGARAPGATCGMDRGRAARGRGVQHRTHRGTHARGLSDGPSGAWSGGLTEPGQKVRPGMADAAANCLTHNESRG
jgi:hypothetical protein